MGFLAWKFVAVTLHLSYYSILLSIFQLFSRLVHMTIGFLNYFERWCLKIEIYWLIPINKDEVSPGCTADLLRGLGLFDGGNHQGISNYTMEIVH